MSVQNLRNIETGALGSSRARIDKKAAEALVAELKTTKEPAELDQSKAVLRDMLAHDAFEPGARAMIQEKVGKSAEKSGLAGLELGKTSQPGTAARVNVSVAKELGPPGGFRDKFQAIGVARASGLANTAVVKVGGSWHPVQTNIAIPKGFTADKKAGDVTGVPPPLSKTDYETLQKKAAAALSAAKEPNFDTPMGKVAKAPEMVKAQMMAAEAEYTALAAAALGVSPTDINVLPANSLNPDKINLMLDFPKVTPNCKCAGHDNAGAFFGNKNGTVDLLSSEPGARARAPHGIVFGPDPFTDQVKAAGVLAHEGTHKMEHDLGDQLKAQFDGNPKAQKKTFGIFVTAQNDAKKITLSERDSIHEQTHTNGDTGQSEGAAYLEELIATLASSPAGDKNVKGTINNVVRRASGLSEDEKAKIKDLANSVDPDRRKALKPLLVSIGMEKAE
jgi:hypothetical protein